MPRRSIGRARGLSICSSWPCCLRSLRTSRTSSSRWEEPETAIPPYAQKRIVHEIRELASQTLFTSHSPYVLEEYALNETVVLGRSADGLLSKSAVVLPKSIKLKAYRQNFRIRFSEGLLAASHPRRRRGNRSGSVSGRLSSFGGAEVRHLFLTGGVGHLHDRRRRPEQHSRHGQALSGDRQARVRHLR